MRSKGSGLALKQPRPDFKLKNKAADTNGK